VDAPDAPTGRRPEANPAPASTGAAGVLGDVSDDPAGAFDAFYLGCHASLVRALSLTLADDDLGRDAAAEGLTRALQRWRKVSQYANPAGWTYRVGLNWARSRRRKLLRELHVARPEAPTPSTDTGPSDPTILDALRHLSLDHRAVVVGRYYLDWSEAELAEALDVPKGTVKSRLSRALERLAPLLEDHDA
jgi:RNA polymerase sigma-70 factor (ECF subfamily)